MFKNSFLKHYIPLTILQGCKMDFGFKKNKIFFYPIKYIRSAIKEYYKVTLTYSAKKKYKTKLS